MSRRIVIFTMSKLHKSLNLFNILILLFRISGCVLRTENTSSIPSTETPQSLVVTPTLLATVTPQKVSLPGDSVFQNLCPEIVIQPINDFAKGTLVVFHRDFSGSGGYLDLHSGKKSPSNGGEVSPKRNRIAYWGLNENYLSSFLVIDTIGETRPIQPASPDVGISTRYWLDNERLVIRVYKNLSGPPPIDAPPHEIAIFNPFTGEVKKLVPNFPNISQKEVDWNFAGPAYYDQSLDYVLYAAWDDIKNTHEYVLYRISSQSKLAALPGSAYGGAILSAGEFVPRDGVSENPPQWSPDNTRVALISIAPEKQADVDEIFAITKNGEVQRLTYFANQFEKAKLSGLNWSPDGKSLAFWVSLKLSPYELPKNAYQDVRLGILNAETLELTIYCLSGDNIGLQNGVPSPEFIGKTIPAPIWSPNGTQIVMENRFADNVSRLIILDIPSNKAMQIGQNLEPLGWMISTP